MAVVSHNKGVSYCGRIVLFLCVALVGCSTASHQRPPDFTLVPEPEQVVVAEPAPIVPAKPVPAPTPAPAPLSVAVPAPAPTNRFPETWVSLERWSRVNSFAAPKRISSDVSPAYAITTSNGTMTVKIGSQTAHWNGLQYLLGFAPQMVEGRPSIHNLDVRKNFEPLVNYPTGVIKSNRVIVIDPGHGGVDTGAKSAYNNQFEKDFTLDLARRLQALLVTNGWTILLTRTNDLNLALSNRVAFAEQHKADLFLSLHFNSAFPDHEQAGLETYCLTPTGMPSNLTRGFRDNAGLTFPNNKFDAQNLQYAVLLHRAVLKVNGYQDRGVRRARFLGVLQGQNRPAVLVEGGYLSNPKEARQIADPAYRQKLAETLAGALLQDSGTLSVANPSPAITPPASEVKTN
jgi:N-acetylmuramoyl-L-alanine amidase